MKLAALVVTTLVAVAAANEYQPALRALAAPEPASEHAHLPTTPNASGDTAVKELTKDKKKKEWFGGFGWGGPWGGWGSCGGCGGWGGWGGIGGWGGVGGWGW